MWYEELGRTANTNQTSISVASLPVRRFLRIIAVFSVSTSNQPLLRFNGSGGNNYSWQAETNNGTLGNAVNANGIALVSGSTSAPNRMFIMDLHNIGSIKTGFFYHAGVSGIGSVPGYFTGVGAYSGGNITRVDILAQSGNLGDAELIILGHD